MLCTGGFNRARIIKEQFLVRIAQPNFGTDRNLVGNSTTNGRNDPIQIIRAFQKRCASFVLVDGFGWAAEIDINARRAKGCRKGRIFTHQFRVMPHQLDQHRHA